MTCLITFDIETSEALYIIEENVFVPKGVQICFVTIVIFYVMKNTYKNIFLLKNIFVCFRIADLFNHNEADEIRDRKDKFKRLVPT